MNAMDVISNVELCDRHAVEMLVNFLELEDAKEILCQAIDEGDAVKDFQEFVELNTSPNACDDIKFDESMSEEDEDFLRELEAYDESDAHQVYGYGEPDEDEFTVDTLDLYLLAETYLQHAIRASVASFYLKKEEAEKEATVYMERFDDTANYLSSENRTSIIDDLDQKNSELGDLWEVFKYAVRPDFWTTPASFDAVVRVAESELGEEASNDEAEDDLFYATLRRVRSMKLADNKANWSSEGF